MWFCFLEVIVFFVYGCCVVIELLLFFIGGIVEIWCVIDMFVVFIDEFFGMVNDFVEDFVECIIWLGRDVLVICLFDIGVN